MSGCLMMLIMLLMHRDRGRRRACRVVHMPPVTCRLLWSGARWVAPLLLLATPCAADVVLPGYTTGLGNSAVYVLFSDGSDTAVQMTEGASLKAGTYTASDSAIATASLGAGTYSATIRLGDYSSPSASDTVVGVVDRFVWTGSVERDDLAEVYTDTNTTIPATLTTVNGKLGNPSVTLADDINDVLTATGTTVTQTTAGAIRTALGLAAANMDTQFGDVAAAADLATLDAVADAIKAVTDLLPDGGALTTINSNASTAATQSTAAATSAAAAATAAAAAQTASEAVETKLPAAGRDIAGAGDTATNLDEVSGGGGGSNPAPFLNRKPNATVKVSSRSDSYLTSSRVRVLAGETYVVALEYPNPNDWLFGMTLPVSPDTDQLTVDSDAYGVNRNLAVVEVTIASSGLSAGDTITLPVVVQPEQGTTDKRKILFEVIDPTQ